MSVFFYHSSEIDWCEDNYKHSEIIVEYFNTISNAAFFIVAPIMMYLLHPYARERNLAVHLVWLMVIIVGLFSMYFHMTLSFMGQMLDELSILWLLAMGYNLWFPRSHFPSFIKDRSTFSRMVMVVTTITTLSAFVKPTVNAFVLNCFAIHILYSLGLQLRSCSNPKALRLAHSTVVLWILAVSCWISDRFSCSFWKSLNFCYLHGFWHILIALATVFAVPLLCYLDALTEIPYALPDLQYWPCDMWGLGFPYVVLRGATMTRRSC